MVITGLTRNQLYLTVPWVRIPLAPPKNQSYQGFCPYDWAFFLKVTSAYMTFGNNSGVPAGQRCVRLSQGMFDLMTTTQKRLIRPPYLEASLVFSKIDGISADNFCFPLGCFPVSQVISRSDTFPRTFAYTYSCIV